MSCNPSPVLESQELQSVHRGDVLRKGNGAETAQMTRKFSTGGRDFLLVFMFSRHPRHKSLRIILGYYHSHGEFMIIRKSVVVLFSVNDIARRK